MSATADFTYVRLLGDRRGIEEKTKVWNRVIVDRKASLSEWVKYLRRVVGRGVRALVYANNHYAGYGPETTRMFQGLWND